jgi:hypothetical protein
VKFFVNILRLYGETLLAPRPTTKVKKHPLSAVSDCLLNVFAATLHICRPFLHPQPEDAHCRGDSTGHTCHVCFPIQHRLFLYNRDEVCLLNLYMQFRLIFILKAPQRVTLCQQPQCHTCLYSPDVATPSTRCYQYAMGVTQANSDTAQ